MRAIFEDVTYEDIFPRQASTQRHVEEIDDFGLEPDVEPWVACQMIPPEAQEDDRQLYEADAPGETI